MAINKTTYPTYIERCKLKFKHWLWSKIQPYTIRIACKCLTKYSIEYALTHRNVYKYYLETICIDYGKLTSSQRDVVVYLLQSSYLKCVIFYITGLSISKSTSIRKWYLLNWTLPVFKLLR